MKPKVRNRSASTLWNVPRSRNSGNISDEEIDARSHGITAIRLITTASKEVLSLERENGLVCSENVDR